MSAPDDRVTARQLRYLRELAARTATTFTYPATRRQASGEIARLRTLPRQPRERQLGGEQTAPACATAVDPSEVAGYGSTASWRSHRSDADV